MVEADTPTYDMVYFGNPIQDITVKDDDGALLTKYKL
jgi:hypothetical protein